MIINLNGKVKNNEIIFEDCPVYFDNNQYVHVNELYIKWLKPCKNVVGYIESSLIDRSPVNLSQQLLFFQQRKESDYLFYTPTHLSKYKIQCSALHSSLFKIHLLEQEKKEKIEKIYIQLEITNARLQ